MARNALAGHMLHMWDLPEACLAGGIRTQGAPEVTRRRARQVWGFGGVSIIMDSATQLVRAQMDDRWAPVSLGGLLAEQQRRAAAKAAKN